MEKQPSYILMLSLTEIALRRVAVILWSESDVLASIAMPGFNPMTYCESKNAQDIVEGKVLNLVLPEALKKQIMRIVRPIGLEIYGWKGYHERILSDPLEEFGVPILEKVCWTTKGTVDYRKTAEELVRCKMINIVKCYRLACWYCLEDYIPTLWEELPERVKKYFYNDGYAALTTHPLLPFCWPYILKGEESKLDDMSRSTNRNPISFHQDAFDYSAHIGNKAAAEYFFKKLTLVQEGSLIETARCLVTTRDISLSPEICTDHIPLEKYSEVLCYLLSLMTPEQQMEILKKDPSCFLRCFLDWPWQDLFLEVSDHIWTFIPASDYGNLLRMLMNGFTTSNYCFPELFQEFFIRSPIDFRKYFVDEESQFYSFFPKFLNSQDSGTIEAIFRNIDIEDRARLVCSYNFFYVAVDLIREDKWHILEVYLREATLSKEDRERLKGEIFRAFLSEYDELIIKPQRKLKPRKWRRLFHLLDEIYASAPSKGKSEGETLTKAKRLGRKK